MTKQIELACFIVPNSNYLCGYGHTTDKGEFYDADHALMDRCRKFGFPIERNEETVKVWILDRADFRKNQDNCDSNWTDHGIPHKYLRAFGYRADDENLCYSAYAPSRIPYRFLKNMREGDTIMLPSLDPEYIITMTFEQKPYRYRRFGAFEDVVKALHDRFNRKDAVDWKVEMGYRLPTIEDLDNMYPDPIYKPLPIEKAS